MKIRMLRNVLVDGQHCAAGEVVEVADNLGAVLVRMGRAEEMAGEDPLPNPLPRGEGTELETATRPAARRRSGKGEL